MFFLNLYKNIIIQYRKIIKRPHQIKAIVQMIAFCKTFLKVMFVRLTDFVL